MTETLLDRIARALADVPIRQDENGRNVVLGLGVRLDMAGAALAVIRPELECLNAKAATREINGSIRVLPARFVTDAMARVPDVLPDNFR
ncbi:hypothetical protein [Streptomyces sp. B1I3]|uniref:hypothetical protein n=1 Tax=Streptomyces sp. B1I3 TaxID=3042264 RepID=UPI00277E0623|nr:hypothetical protein [Streptomyces sp. B1I3]MDQ0792033.1 hypothetical protein [Streptomyces sp. B1I3]